MKKKNVINVLMNTQTAYKNFFSSRNIFIVLTYKCNAFCEKCITRYNRFRNQSMTADNCRRIADLLVSNDYSGTINLGSGESFTYSLLPEFVEYLLNYLPLVRFRILSNGMLISPKIPEIFFSPRVTFGVTFDGFYNEDLLNLQRGVDIEIVKNNIRAVCSDGHSQNFYLNYTLNKQNLKSLKEFIDFAAELNIPQVYTTEMKIYEKFTHLDKYRLSELEKKYVADLEDYAKSLNFKEVSFDTVKPAHFRDKCFKKIGGVSPIIDLDGSVAFCYGQEDKFMGNIFDEKSILKWALLKDSLLRNENQAEKWCSHCYSKQDNNAYISVPLALNPYLERG